MQQRARAQALRDLVDERLQIEEARRFEIAVTSDTIDRRLADIARQNETSNGRRLGLKAAGALSSGFGG